MKRRDLMKYLSLLPVSSALSMLDRPHREVLEFLTADDEMKKDPFQPRKVFLDNEDVADQCIAMCASPSPNIPVEGWCELIVGANPDAGIIDTVIRTGTVCWEYQVD